MAGLLLPRGRSLALEPFAVMAIVNVTPDSFFAPSRRRAAAEALDAAMAAFAAGAMTVCRLMMPLPRCDDIFANASYSHVSSMICPRRTNVKTQFADLELFSFQTAGRAMRPSRGTSWSFGPAASSRASADENASVLGRECLEQAGRGARRGPHTRVGIRISPRAGSPRDRA